MKLTGSRSTATFDRYSDWDYTIEGRDDFAWIETQLVGAACWRIYRRGSLWILTVLKPDLEMVDCGEAQGACEAEWHELEQRQEHIALSDYWIIAAKHLKGFFRGYDLLADVGLEYSLQILRGLYLESKLGVREYQDFYHYKTAVFPRQAELGELFAVTGLPTRTRPERIAKLSAMNTLARELAPDFAPALGACIQAELEWIQAH